MISEPTCRIRHRVAGDGSSVPRTLKAASQVTPLLSQECFMLTGR